jgi:hypothetical protein
MLGGLFRRIPKPFEEFLVQKSILLKCPGLVILEFD